MSERSTTPNAARHAHLYCRTRTQTQTVAQLGPPLSLSGLDVVDECRAQKEMKVSYGAAMSYECVTGLLMLGIISQTIKWKIISNQVQRSL